MRTEMDFPAKNGATLKREEITPVLLIKTGVYPHHHGTLAAIRTFGRAGVPVYGIHETGDAPAARSRYLSRAFIGVLPRDDPSACIDRLCEIGQVIGRQCVLIP